MEDIFYFPVISIQYYFGAPAAEILVFLRWFLQWTKAKRKMNKHNMAPISTRNC